MAKKYTNELTGQFIPIVNNSEIYKLGKALTDKELFSMIPEKLEAITNIIDSKKNIVIQITEYDVMKNPALLMQTTKHEEILTKVSERLNNLDQDTGDMYKILFAHWMVYKVKDNLENSGRAYIEINQIHTEYKRLKVTGQDAGVPQYSYENYIKAIDILANTNVKIDITKETNIAYEKLKRLGWGAIEGVLINNLIWVWNTNNTKRIGLWYDLGLIGEAYTEHAIQINNKYPSTFLQLDGRQHFTVKNIGNYLCYLHRCNQNSKNTQTVLNLYSLMVETRFELKYGRTQQYINIFMKNISKVNEILQSNKIVKEIIIPTGVHSKNYKDSQIIINWLYD